MLPLRQAGGSEERQPLRFTRRLVTEKETGMHQLALGVAAVVALAIIVIGALYLARPRAATLSFGLPLPEEGPNIAWWLRLKGVRATSRQGSP